MERLNSLGNEYLQNVKYCIENHEIYDHQRKGVIMKFIHFSRIRAIISRTKFCLGGEDCNTRNFLKLIS